MTVSQKVKDALKENNNDDLAEVVEECAPIARSVGMLYKSLYGFFRRTAAPASRIAATAAKAATTETFSVMGRQQNEAADAALEAADAALEAADDIRDGSFWEEAEEEVVDFESEEDWREFIKWAVAEDDGARYELEEQGVDVLEWIAREGLTVRGLLRASDMRRLLELLSYEVESYEGVDDLEFALFEAWSIDRAYQEKWASVDDERFVAAE